MYLSEARKNLHCFACKKKKYVTLGSKFNTLQGSRGQNYGHFPKHVSPYTLVDSRVPSAEGRRKGAEGKDILGPVFELWGLCIHKEAQCSSDPWSREALTWERSRTGHWEECHCCQTFFFFKFCGSISRKSLILVNWVY